MKKSYLIKKQYELIRINKNNFKKANWKKINEEILFKQDNKEFQWLLIEITEKALELEAEKL